MSSLEYERIVASKPFRILVGSNKKEFMVHADLLAHMSKPLGVLVKNGMKESSEGVAEWPEVDEGTSVRFCQFAYTGSYEEPVPEFIANVDDGSKKQSVMEIKSIEPEYEYPVEVEPEATPDDNWDFLIGRARSKKAALGRSRHSNGLWDRFKELNYAVPSSSAKAPELPSTSHLDYTKVFLSHARLYVLADYYDIQALVMLSLKNLHKLLVRFELASASIGGIATLVEYSF